MNPSLAFVRLIVPLGADLVPLANKKKRRPSCASNDFPLAAAPASTESRMGTAMCEWNYMPCLTLWA